MLRETVKRYWGDGTNSIGVNGNNTHIYAASGVYTVKIESKVFGGLYFNDMGDKAKIVNGVFWSWGGALTYRKFLVAAHLLRLV